MLPDISLENIVKLLMSTGENAKTMKTKKYLEGMKSGFFESTTFIPMNKKKNDIATNMNGKNEFIVFS